MLHIRQNMLVVPAWSCIGAFEILPKIPSMYWKKQLLWNFKNCQVYECDRNPPCLIQYFDVSNWHLPHYRRHGDGLCPVWRQRELHTSKGTCPMKTSSCWLILPDRSNVSLSLTSHIYHENCPTQYVTLQGSDRYRKYLQLDRTFQTCLWGQ